MPGPAPKRPEERRRRNQPAAGEWQPAPGEGWQHGPVPKPPTGLVKASRDAWETWMGSWWAAFWTPADLPGLYQLIRLYDRAWREPDVVGFHSQLRQLMDTYGVTPKGRQDRRWKRPEATPEQAKSKSGGTYGHLRPVANDE